MTADEKIARICVKVERAKKHFDDLKVARQRFLDTKPYAYIFEDDTQTGHIKIRMTRVDPVPDDIGLIIGDFAHNLRSALDHLARQLVIANGKDPIIQTAFPVFHSADKCVAMNTGKVQGMSDAAKDAIRLAEPYLGGKGHYLWTLNELDVIDKHHTLLTGIASLTQVIMAPTAPPSLNPQPGMYTQVYTIGEMQTPGFRSLLKAGDVIVTFNPEDYENVKPALDVAFGEPEVVEGHSIVEVGQYMIQLVERTIGGFRSHLE